MELEVACVTRQTRKNKQKKYREWNEKFGTVSIKSHSLMPDDIRLVFSIRFGYFPHEFGFNSTITLQSWLMLTIVHSPFTSSKWNKQSGYKKRTYKYKPKIEWNHVVGSICWYLWYTIELHDIHTVWLPWLMRLKIESMCWYTTQYTVYLVYLYTKHWTLSLFIGVFNFWITLTNK